MDTVCSRGHRLGYNCNLKPTMKTNVILLVLLIVSVSPVAQAVSPPPDGGYPGGNTAEGQNALLSLTIGTYNTAVGVLSLRSNTEGSFNTAIGAGALLANVGNPSNGAGIENTATGAGALLSNATGGFNTANGAFALFSNADGFDDTATGVSALSSNTTGSSNVAYGDSTLQSNTVGSNNTAMGYQALVNTTGNHNIGLGVVAGSNLTTGDSNIDIDNPGTAGESNTIRIGNASHTQTFIAGISGAVLGSGTQVFIDTATGQLGIALSSRRFKKDIEPMDKASETILALKPATFCYKNDAKKVPQFGLIAEEVAEVNPNLVVRDKNGDIYTVRYDAVNAMLLNEFLKEHRKVQELEKGIAALAAQLNEQGTEIHQVSAQVEMNKPTPRVAFR